MTPVPAVLNVIAIATTYMLMSSDLRTYTDPMQTNMRFSHLVEIFIDAHHCM